MNKQQGAQIRARRERAKRESVEQGSWTFELPYPPSANEYWRSRAVRGAGGKTGVQVYVSDKARQFKARAVLLARQAGVQPLAGAVELQLALYPPSKRPDASNACKIVEDALNAVAYVDDNQIARIVIERIEVDAQSPAVVVTVRNYDPAARDRRARALEVYDSIGRTIERVKRNALDAGKTSLCFFELDAAMRDDAEVGQGGWNARVALDSEFAEADIARALINGQLNEWR